VRKRHLAVTAALIVFSGSLSSAPAFAAQAPAAPTNLATTPTPQTASGAQQPCGTGIAYAGSMNIGGVDQAALSATLNSGGDTAGNLSAAFTVVDKTTGTTLAPIDSAGQVGSGASVTVYLPVTDGHSYSWTVAATDGTNWSSSAGPCDFITDTTAPLNPTVTSADFPISGGGLESGEPGSFTLTSSDPAPATGTASGLRGYSYVFDSGVIGVGTPVIAPNDNGSLVISDQSFTWGSHTLYAQAVDNAGNVSATVEYSFYVPQNPELSPKLSLSAAGAVTVDADGSGSTGLWPIAKCSFDFGDQSAATVTTGSACTATHEYAKDGTYPVTLTITDQYGNQKSVIKDFATPGLSRGTLFHEILLPTTVTGWASPAGSTGIAQAANTALPDGSSQLVAVTSSGELEHNIRFANGSWQGWRTLSQPGVTVTDAGIAGMPNGSSQIIEVTSAGVLKHDIRNANGSWQTTGWGSPAGSTGIAQASITAMPNGSSQIVAVTTSGMLKYNIRSANGSWQGWVTLSQPGVMITHASIAGMPNGSSQIIEVTSAGVLKHDIRNANGSWQTTGWGSPAGSTGIVQATITAMSNGSSQIVATRSSGIVAFTIRSASGGWPSAGWGQLANTVKVDAAANVSIAGMPNGTSQVIEVSAI